MAFWKTGCFGSREEAATPATAAAPAAAVMVKAEEATLNGHEVVAEAGTWVFLAG